MLYLASQSPRRRQLLEAVGLEFLVLTPDIEEHPHDDELPEATAKRLALEKAAAGIDVIAREGLARHAVLAADTLVVADGEVMGKPRGSGHGFEMLARLSGRTHRVLTAVALHDGEASGHRVCESFVTMKTLSRREIERYWSTGEPADKAGGYAIQGIGSGFVARLEGSYSGVVGLPLFETRELLTEAGLDWL